MLTKQFEIRSTQIRNSCYNTDRKEFSKAGEHRRAIVAYIWGATCSTVYCLSVGLSYSSKASYCLFLLVCFFKLVLYFVSLGGYLQGKRQKRVYKWDTILNHCGAWRMDFELFQTTIRPLIGRKTVYKNAVSA